MRAAPRASLALVVVIIGIAMSGSLTRIAEPVPLCYAGRVHGGQPLLQPAIPHCRGRC
jgi:hypothetical protein